MTLIGKRHQPANGIEDFGREPVGRIRTVHRNVIKYAVEIREGFRMKCVATAYAERSRCACVFAFRRAKASSPSIGFTIPLFRSS